MKSSKNKPAERFIQHIRKQYEQFKLKKHLSGLLASLSVIMAGIALLVWLEQQAYFSSTTKTVIGALLVVAACGLYLRIARAFRGTTFRTFYSRLSDGIGFPQLKYALDLSLHSRGNRLKLHEIALRKNLEILSWDKLSQEIAQYTKEQKETTLFKKSAVVALCTVGVLSFTGMVHSDAFMRTTRFWENFQKPNPYSFTIHPGNATIEQGSSFQPEIAFSGNMPGELLLAIKTDVENRYRYRPLRETADGRFRSEPIKLSTDASYFVQMDEFNSDRYEVGVQLRPRFESLSVTVIQPEYTGLDSASYTYPFSQVKAYRGSRIQINARTNKPVEEMVMRSSVFGDSLAAVTPDEEESRHQFAFEKNISESDTLQFVMSDSSGLTNNNRFEFAVDAVEDEYPFVQILNPEGNLQLSSPAPVETRYQASDDFGITSVRLHYEIQRAFVENSETGSVKVPVPPLNSNATYMWDITELNPRPRDVITFWIRVTDNDGYSGFKSSQSRKLTITLPSLVENLEDIERQETDLQQSLEEISESHEEMRREYERFKENLKENPETNWEQQQMLDEVSKRQEQIDKEVDELNKKFQEIREEIDKNNMVSEETRRAYEELQKLIEEINDPELMNALEELQKAMGKFNQQQLRRALENFEFNEEIYRERLNRTLQLFKSLKLNSDLEKIATALEDLAEKEGELSESDAPPTDQTEQQEAIDEDAGNISDQLDKLNDDPPQDAQEKVEQLQRESRQDMESIRKQLRENIEQMKRENSGTGNQQQRPADSQSPSSRQQQQLQQQFQQMAQKMRQAKQQLNQQRIQVNMAALQHILYNLVNLSEEQEDLTQNTESLANRSQAFVDNARIEKNISVQFAKVADSLFAVSTQIPGFSNKINKMKKEVERDLDLAVEQLAERNKSQSTYAERQSLGGINELASMVASLMERLQQQSQNGMGGGMSMQQFMEQLKNMSGSQQQLNRQIQNLINDIQGERLTRDQIDRLNQMARQQNMIRKQLQQLREQGGLEAGDRLLSELERMAEEMEETINDLRGGQADRLLMKRQQNILSRMLSAEKAIQERDEEERREGTAVEEAPQTVPPDVTLEELQQRIRNLLNDPNQTKFSDDYQKLIEQYFELLKKLRGDPASS